MDFLKNNEKKKQAIEENLDIAFVTNIEEDEEKSTFDEQWQVSRNEKRRRKNLARRELMSHTLMFPEEREQHNRISHFVS